MKAAMSIRVGRGFSMKSGIAVLLIAGAALSTAPAAAQGVFDPAGDRAPGTVAGGPPAPAPAPAPASICTDRPTRANVVCTAPRGDFQLEADAINWTRFSSGDGDTDTILYSNPTIKYGLGTTTDVELNIAPYETVHGQRQGPSDTLGGVGDLFVRVKQQLTAPGARTQVALIPYVKAPTARFGIGNGRWEGGIILPVIFALPSGFYLNFGPEVDIVSDGDRNGYHANVVGLVNLSHAVGKKGTIYAEFWSTHNIDPVGTVHQYSADVAYAYLTSPRLQIDIGGNFGLSRFTPQTQVYAGASTRF